MKTWVNAKITIAPDETNQVGQPHTFTVTLLKDTGTAPASSPAAGEHVDRHADATPTARRRQRRPAPASRRREHERDRSVPGHVHLERRPARSPGTRPRRCRSAARRRRSRCRPTASRLNSGDAVKTFVNAKIPIAPNATNEVGQPHTFTVTLQKDAGTGHASSPAAGEHVDVTLTDSNGAAHTAATGTCTDAGANTNAAGQCTITFTSPTAGQGDRARVRDALGRPASARSPSRPTAPAGNSADAVKTFVDANIQITPPTARTAVGTTHTFTAHVNVNAGDGDGFVNAPAGTPITFTNDSGPARFTTAEPVHHGRAATGQLHDHAHLGRRPARRSSARTSTILGRRPHADAHTNGVGRATPARRPRRWVNARIAITPNATNAGRPAAHVHGHAAEGHRRRRRLRRRRRASTSTSR